MCGKVLSLVLITFTTTISFGVMLFRVTASLNTLWIHCRSCAHNEGKVWNKMEILFGGHCHINRDTKTGQAAHRSGAISHKHKANAEFCHQGYGAMNFAMDGFSFITCVQFCPLTGN